MDRSDTIRLAKLAAAGAAVWWVAKKATGAATAAIEHAAAPRQAAVNGLGILTFLDRTGDWSTITGEGGLPLQLADDGGVYERLGAVLVRHDLDVNGIREALVWSGLAGSLDVDSIMREGRHGGLDGFKLKKVLKKVKSVADKMAVHKIVAKAVLGKKGAAKLSNLEKRSIPYLMIAGAAAATIFTAGAATPVLVGAIASGAASLASQAAKDVAARRAAVAARRANQGQAMAQAQADADLVTAQAQADGTAQGDYDARQGVRYDEPTEPDAAQPQAYRTAYKTAYVKAFNAVTGVEIPKGMFQRQLPQRTETPTGPGIAPPNYFATQEQQAQPAEMPPNYFAPQAPRIVTPGQVQMRPQPQGSQPVYYPPRYDEQAEDQTEDEPAEAEVMAKDDTADENAEDAFIAEDDGDLSGADESDDGESYAEVLTDDYADGSNYRAEDYAASGIPAPTGMEPGASSYGVF